MIAYTQNVSFDGQIVAVRRSPIHAFVGSQKADLDCIEYDLLCRTPISWLTEVFEMGGDPATFSHKEQIPDRDDPPGDYPPLKIDLAIVRRPEFDLHPAKIREYIARCREVVESGTQIAFFTNNTLLLNELRGDEISVVTRRQGVGVEVTLLQDTYDYARRSEKFENGALWLEYSDGDQDPLLFGSPYAGSIFGHQQRAFEADMLRHRKRR